MTDRIADMLARIRNAYAARKREAEVPRTKVLEHIVALLKEEHYIEDYRVEERQPQSVLVLTLRYVDRKPAMTDALRVSRPGRRKYSTVDTLPRTLGGFGTTIVSTSKGVLTGKQAKKLGVGGEVLCQVW